MIITNVGETVEGTITSLKTEGFKIANTAHMMEILSKRLYSNPELAVCRELVCNAIDAHKAVNNPAPVEVTLPDWTNDFRFIVKDYGTGLAEEEVLNLYTTYGASTKQSSNNFIGCLGIGSKSPFAVTEEFSVVSRYNGKATTYHCYKQKGMPLCTKLSEVATDEHNGMTITVPFTNDNYLSFINNCLTFFNGVNKDVVSVTSSEPLQFFEDFVGKVNFTWEEYSVYVRTEFYQSDYVRMGQVLYKVPHSWCRDSVFNSNYNIIVDVPIGMFTIAASRENIEENEDNKRKFIQLSEVLKRKYYKQFLLPYLKKTKTFTSYKRLRQYCHLFDYHDVIDKVFKKTSWATDESVGYCKTWSKEFTKGKLKSREDVYVNRCDSEVFAIREDVPPVSSYGNLIKKWTEEHAKENRRKYVSYALVNKEHLQRYSHNLITDFSFKNVVFTSQLNEWFEMLQSQAKRRRKTCKKPVRTDNFMLVKFGAGVYNQHRTYYDRVKDADVLPYVVLKEFQLINKDEDKYIEQLYRYDVPCYGVSLCNSKGLPPQFVPIKQYVEEHQQHFEDLRYKDNRRRVLSALQLAQRERRQYTRASIKEMLGKDAWLDSFTVSTPEYLPKSYSDVLFQQLVEKYKRYKKFLTGVSTWFNIYYYKDAPEEIKSYIQKLYKDMVVSEESTADNK